MACVYKPLGSLVEIKTGALMGRAKKVTSGGEAVVARVLVPAAMSHSCVLDDRLVTETVSKVKKDLFTKTGDVIVKASTPYDCVFVDRHHEGLLVTSFGFILRPPSDSAIDGRYLALFLGLRQTNEVLQGMSKGVTVQLLRKRDIESLPVPVPSPEDQRSIAYLFEEVQKYKVLCRAMAEKSDVLLRSEFARMVCDFD